MQLPILTLATAPAGSASLLDDIADDLGFVPNLAATAAASPPLLAALDAVRRIVNGPDFDPVRREVAGVAVGVVVDNRYGVAWHSTALARLGVDDAEIERMRAGLAPSDPTLAAVYTYARAVALTRGAVPDDVVECTCEAGLDIADLLHVVTEAVFATLVGIVDNVAGHVALDEGLEPRAWTPLDQRSR